MDDDMRPDCYYYDCQAFNNKYKNSKGQFSTIHFNMRSVKNKVDDLEVLLHSLTLEFDAIALTETWLTKEDVPPQLQGYSCESLSREKKRGGGIALYLKNHFQYQVIDNLTRIDENVESLFVNISNVVVAVLYRPPSGNMFEFMAFLDSALCYLGTATTSFFILGDVNIDTISDDLHAREFRDVTHQYACSNVITLPTRVTADTATSLDVCITNVDNSQT